MEYTDTHPEVTLVLSANRRLATGHALQFNLPTTSEVTVILPGEQNNLDIMLQKRGGQLQHINELHRSYDPLCSSLSHGHQ